MTRIMNSLTNFLNSARAYYGTEENEAHDDIMRMKAKLDLARSSKPYSSENMARILYSLREFFKREKIYYGTDENAVCSYTDPSLDEGLDCERNVSIYACGGGPSRMGGFGPELLFAHIFPKHETRFEGTQIGITKVSVGGSRICQWMKNSACSSKPNYWHALVEAIQASQGTMEAFIWFQGEKDSSIGTSTENYLAHLTELVNDVRLEIFNASTKFENATDVPVVIVELGAKVYERSTDVIEAQRLFVER